MKKIKYTSLLLLVWVVSALFFACKKTADMPPVTPFSVGNTITVSQLRALFNSNGGNNYKFLKDVSLYATVTMTDNYKTLYVRDNTGAISVKQLTAHGIFAGDSLRINLNGSWLDLSGVASSIQIDSLDVSNSSTNKVVKLAVGKQITPINVTIAELNHSVSNITYNSITGNFFVPQSMYDGQLVQIDGVQFAFTDTGRYIIPNTGALYFNHSLYDCGSLNNINMSLYSGTADFSNQRIPTTQSGSIIAAVSFYNDALQLTPRSFADLTFNQPRCGLKSLNQTFDTTSFGAGATFTTLLFPGWVAQRQVGSSIFWAGTSSGSTNFPSASVQYSSDTRNVTWLISPPIQNSSTKNISFQVSTTNNLSNISLLDVFISTDFNGYNLGGVSGVQFGTQANWIKITSSFNITTNGSSNAWIFYSAGTNVPLSSAIPYGYTGTFYVGFRYTGVKALQDSAAAYGINNVIIKD